MDEPRSDRAAERENLWQSIGFSLAQTPEPMLAWVTTAPGEALRREFARFRKTFPHRKHLVLDVSDRQVDSLTEVLEEKLPEHLKRGGAAAEQFVHIFGLGNSADPLSDSPLLKSMNSERNIIFRRFRCVLVVWSEPFFRERLRAEAKDFWDWLVLDFNFQKLEVQQPIADTSPSRPMRGLIVYSEADRDIKNDLEDVLLERFAGRAEWVFRTMEGIREGEAKIWDYDDVDFVVLIVSKRFLSTYRRPLEFGTGIYLKSKAENEIRYNFKFKLEEFQRNTFEKIKNRTFWRPALILAESCNWENYIFYQPPILIQKTPPLREIDDERKYFKALGEIAEQMVIRADSVRHIYQGRKWEMEYSYTDANPKWLKIVEVAMLALLLISAGLGWATPVFFLWLLIGHFRWWSFLVLLFQLWNWHPHLSKGQLWAKIATTPSYLKFVLFSHSDAVIASDNDYVTGLGLSTEITDRFSWPETLLFFTLPFCRAISVGAFFMAIFALFKWENLWWWLVVPAALFATLPLSARLKKLVERRARS